MRSSLEAGQLYFNLALKVHYFLLSSGRDSNSLWGRCLCILLELEPLF